MLVLGRGVGERVFLDLPGGDRIEVTVVVARDGRTRLGFDAPRDVRITREEVAERIAAEAAAA